MCSYFGVIKTKRLGKWTLLEICLNKLAMYNAWDVCDTCIQQVCIKQSWSPVNIESQRVFFLFEVVFYWSLHELEMLIYFNIKLTPSPY